MNASGWRNVLWARYRLLPALAIVILPFTACWPQATITRLYTPADGLADRVVIDVHRDAQGFLWIYTQRGLQRFDGHRFEDRSHLVPDSLKTSFSEATYFHVDPDGWFWLVDRHGRVALRFDPVTEEVVVERGPVVLPTTKDQQRVCTRLYPFYDIYRGLGEAEVVRQRVVEASRPYGPRVIQRTRDGRTWIHLSDARILVIGPDGGAIEELRPPGVMPLRETWPTIDQDAGIWWPSAEGTLERIQLPNAILEHKELNIHLDDHGNVWLISDRNQLMQVDPVTGAFIDHGRMPGIVSRVYRDEEDLIWLCTEAGLMRMVPRRTEFSSVCGSDLAGSGNVVGISVRGLVESKEGNFFMFNDLGMVMRTSADGPCERLPLQWPGGGAPWVHGACVDGKGRVWLLADGGLYMLDERAGALDTVHQLSGDRIRSVHGGAPGNGFLLVLDNDRGRLFDPLTGVLSRVFPLVKDPTAGVLLAHGRLYVPDARGLRVMDLGTLEERIIDLALKEPLQESNVRGIVLSGSGIHLATEHGILSVDTLSWELVRRIGVAEGLADPVVYSLLGEGGRLWAGTRNGLSLVDPTTGRCVNFRTADGLPFNEFNTGPALVDRKGQCWFGGVNGLVRFDPRSVAAVPRSPSRAYLVQLRSSNERAQEWEEWVTPGRDLAAGIVLSPQERSLSIAFALSSLTDPEAHRFSYYLEGLEPPWLHNGRQAEASYSGLPPGDYRFRVRAFDHRGLKATNELEVPLTVLQVWYLRSWAIAVLFVLGISAVFLILRSALRRRAEQAEAARIRELDAFKDRFFTNVTHEFRTPLTVIMGLADRLEREGDRTDLADKAGLIIRNSRRLLDLLDQVLDLTRLQHGHLVLAPRALRLGAYLHRILAVHRSLAQVRGVDLKAGIHTGERPVMCDPERLRQVIDNLLSNALKFTPTGGTVNVDARLGAGDPGLFYLSIHDTGPGITPDDLPHIFDRFYQGREGATTGGTGIGLALVQELVEAMGGRIRVESEPGAGSLFILELALPAAPEDAAPVEEIPAHPPSVIEPDKSGEALELEREAPVILIVEDDADVGDLIVSCVTGKYQVLRAMDGLKGLELARMWSPDLVLSDVMMPGMDGFALCHALKQDAATSHIPVALLTARTDRPARLEGIGRGADAYLEKPFDERELLAVLDNLHRLKLGIQEHYKHQWEEVARGSIPDLPVTQGRKAEIDLDVEHRFLAQVRAVMETHHADCSFGVEALAEKLNLSRSQVFRKVKALTGDTPVSLLRSFRLAKARSLLQKGGYTVGEVAFACGFNSASYFSDVYLSVYGHRPSDDARA